MFLKKLQIQGFKSFSDKVSLNFKQGVTAIVGPNGSGKSNISDAIRWVLGEQSPKNLRGEKMEDIIFVGTKNRKPLAFAQVSITIDNTDKKLNIDFEQVTITRKVFRNGESGYFINETPCRLKDVYEIFMDTGIGKEGYSIIGQGKIDSILSNKSDDRRAIFEEAVGIVKFKNRKIQAENKLEQVRKNLIRTNDIIEEIENKLKPLKIQQQKAKEYNKLSEQLKEIVINIFKIEYSQFEDDNLQIQKLLDDLENTLQFLENDKNILIEKQQKLKENIVKIDNDIKNNSEKAIKLRLQIESLDSNIKINIKNIEFIDSDIDRINKDFKDFKTTISKKNEEINSIKNFIQTQQTQLSLKNEALKINLVEFEQFKTLNEQNQDNIKATNDKIIQKMVSFSNLQNKINSINENKQQFDLNKQNLQNQKILLQNSLKEKNTRKAVLQKKLSNIYNLKQNLDNGINLTEENISKLNLEFNNLQNSFNQKNMEFNNLTQKIKILSDLKNDYDGYFNSVKAILKEKENNPKFAGVLGVLGEVITVCENFELAIEVATGSVIQNIITNTENDAKIAIDFLKKNKLGRATFLPLSSIKPKQISNLSTLKLEKGFINIASELISFDEKFYNIISNVLGKTLVFDNIENAIAFSIKHNYSFKVVTLQGEIINIGGALSGGSIYKKTGGVFSRNREITQISQNIQIIKDSITLEQQKIKEISEKKQDEIIKLNNLHLNSKNIFQEEVSIKNEISQADFFINDILKNIQNVDNEYENLLQTINLQNEQVVLDEFNQLDFEIKNLKNELINFENKGKDYKHIFEKSLNKINGIKISINSLNSDIENSNSQINRILNEINSINNKNANFDKDINIKKNEQQKLLELINFNKKEIEKLNVQLQQLSQNINHYDDLKNSINFQLENYSNEILDFTTKIGDTNNQITKTISKKEILKTKIDSLAKYIWEQYELTYADACVSFPSLKLSIKDLKQKEILLKKEIASLGTVNLSAIQEFEELFNRYQLNISQRDDILNSDKNLTKMIKTLTNEMEQQFKKQFYLINQNFQQVFAKMFSGGTACLALTDESNVLNSGIEIVAKPPGKNLQTLSLLSGGERTLTAISLLFAILKLKPSPFCILDETEAALDDANVTRYANFLKQISKGNQFILITHKTGTMEIADTLYGVTMQEQGVSKIISVELKDAKQYNN